MSTGNEINNVWCAPGTVSLLRHIFVAVLLGFPCEAVAEPPFNAANCQLASPPALAGDDIIFGRFARVYPRLKDLPRRYTGCQTVWVQGSDGWDIRSMTSFEHGEAVAFWVPPPDEKLCRYRKGKIVSPSGRRCPDHSLLAAKSVAPGCIQKAMTRSDTTGCIYE